MLKIIESNQISLPDVSDVEIEQSIAASDELIEPENGDERGKLKKVVYVFNTVVYRSSIFNTIFLFS